MKTNFYGKILMIFLIMNNCKSQDSNTIDLSQNILGTYIDNIITPDIELIEVDNRSYGTDNSAKSTTNQSLLNFNGVNLYGFVEESSNYKKNKVKFHFSKKDGRIALYQVYTYQTKKSEQLIMALNDFLGKPNFVQYETPEKRNAGVFESKIWHDPTNKISYLLDVSQQDHGKECWLNIVDINNTFFYDAVLSIPSFNYWKKYITFKEHFNKPKDYTYNDYVQEKMELGDELIGVLTEYYE